MSRYQVNFWQNVHHSLFSNLFGKYLTTQKEISVQSLSILIGKKQVNDYGYDSANNNNRSQLMRKLQFVHKLILLSSLILVLALGASAINSYYLLKSKTENDLKAAIKEISASVTNNISDWFNGKSDVVLSMAISAADNLEISDKENGNLINIFKQSDRAGKFKNTYVGIERSRKLIIDDVSIVLPEDYDPTTRPWYQLATRDGKTNLTEPYIDANENYLVISISTPIMKNGQIVAVAGADLQLTDIVNIVNKVDYLGLGYAFLVTEQGKILSHPDKQLANKQLTDIFDTFPTLSANLTTLKIEQKDALVSFHKIEGVDSVDWYIGVVLDKQKAYASLSSIRTQSAIYAVIGVITTILVMSFALNLLMRPIRKLSLTIKDIAHGKGDLTQRLSVDNQDEIGQLSGYFNEFMDKIQHSIRNVKNSAETLNQNIIKVNHVVVSSHALFDEQNARAANVAAAVKRLDESSNDISTNAKEASRITSDAHKTSNESRGALKTNIENVQLLSSKVTNSGELIKELGGHTENIGNILNVIRGISDQTNLLALNAAIEAARAGEQGRGFAVVADEVRQLAHRAADSTNEIQELISNLQQVVDSVGNAMEESTSQSSICYATTEELGEKMVSIMNAINEIDQENLSVASETERQSQTISEMNSEISLLASTNQQGADNLNQISQECNELQQQFSELDRLVGQFRV